MKTEVIMKRELFGMTISQKSKSAMFSATDLVKAGNKWRIENDLPIFTLNEWLRQKNVKQFIDELKGEFKVVKINSRGKNSHTWVHPLLFIDIALAISPKLKIEVYKWLYDSLLDSRNDSGNSYKRMCGTLFVHETNKAMFTSRIKLLARKIREICNVSNWEEATDEQLRLRDSIHHNISIISNVLRDNDRAIQFGIEESLKGQGLNLSPFQWVGGSKG